MIGTRRIRFKTRAKHPEKLARAEDLEAARDRAQRILDSQPEIREVHIVHRRLGVGEYAGWSEEILEVVVRQVLTDVS